MDFLSTMRAKNTVEEEPHTAHAATLKPMVIKFNRHFPPCPVEFISSLFPFQITPRYTQTTIIHLAHECVPPDVHVLLH
jgi:hypothetical protein